MTRNIRQLHSVHGVGKETVYKYGKLFTNPEIHNFSNKQIRIVLNAYKQSINGNLAYESGLSSCSIITFNIDKVVSSTSRLVL